MNKFVVPAVAAFALVAGSAVAAEQDRTQATQPGGTAAQHQEQRAAGGDQATQSAVPAGQHELVGMEVLGQANEEVGEITNVLIDQDGKVHSVVIQRDSGVLGLGGNEVAVPFDKVQLPEGGAGLPADEQRARVDMTDEQLGELPEYESERRDREGRDDAREPAAQPGQTGTTGTTGTDQPRR